MRKGIINEESMVMCPWCDNEYKAKDWNKNTKTHCKTQKMKSMYLDIYNISVWGAKSESYYKCPGCSKWCLGNQLRLLGKNGKIVKGLGGREVIREVPGMIGEEEEE